MTKLDHWFNIAHSIDVLNNNLIQVITFYGISSKASQTTDTKGYIDLIDFTFKIIGISR